MKNFGKLTATLEEIKLGEDIKDEKGNIVQPANTVKINVLKDKDGIEWHDLFKKYPHKFYITVDDTKHIISMTDDPELSQIAGFDIIGIDGNYGETYGPGGSVYGKLWDGEKIVAPPPVFPPLTARQFWQAALAIGVREENLTTGIANKDSPFYIEDEEERESVLIDITKATSFTRDFPLLKKMAEVNKIPDTQLDTLWNWAANIQ
ncbi:hypothetical protein BBC0178_017840 [Bartonella apihabitans]|uniref:Uncharacterized protein n=1 Tax=Bartonella apihabitans TaxID=2750929 RepID=A0A1U9MD87_9HYPH|nr:hypothetical protein [Bartonella apihabitans]AQT43236.1 hypothetical protein BBC0178_017840 [Bartonella apihabitans]